jgi:hypothetical protein
LNVESATIPSTSATKTSAIQVVGFTPLRLRAPAN